MNSARIWIKSNASTHDMMEKWYTYRNQQVSVLSHFHDIPVWKNVSLLISKYEFPQPHLNFYVCLLTETSDPQDDGEIYKNMVQPINIRITKTSLSLKKYPQSTTIFGPPLPIKRVWKCLHWCLRMKQCLHIIDPNVGFLWIHINLHNFTLLISGCLISW